MNVVGRDIRDCHLSLYCILLMSHLKNQNKEFPVTIQEIDVAIAIQGEGIFSLKVNITRKKAIPMIENLIQVPQELIKLHRDIVKTAEIFFVKTIPFFLTLSIKFDLPWYTILRTGKSRQRTMPSIKFTYTIEIGDLGL